MPSIFKIKALIACLLWGSAFVGAKIAFQFAGPILVSGVRFTLAGLLLLPVIWLSGIKIRNELKHWRFMLLFAFVQTFLQYGIFFIGLNKVPGATSAIIIGAGPLFVAIMAHLTLENDKLSLKKIAAVALGLSGVIFISLTKESSTIEYPNFYTGVILLLLSNIIGSYTNIMVVKRKKSTMSPILLTSFANFTGGIMLLIVSFLIEKPEIKIFPLQFYLSIVWLSIIPAAAFSLWYSLLQNPEVKVSELNAWKFFVPVTGCILSWLVLPGESPNIYSITGIIIIIVALWLLQMRNKYNFQSPK